MSFCSCRIACASITFLFILVGVSYADYNIGYTFVLEDFPSVPSSAPDGSCCGSSCSQCCSNVSTIRDMCNFSVIICFRESNLPISDTLAPCALKVTRINNIFFTQPTQATRAITRYFTGGFQAYVRISYVQNTSDPDILPPFSDPVMDEYTFDFNVNLSDAFTINSKTFNSTGQFQRAQVMLSAFASCSPGWNGSDCATFCNESGCTQVYSGPFVDPRTTEPPSFTDPVTQLPVVASEDDIDAVAIGVGVGVGVGGALIICIILLAILLCCCCIKRRKSKDWEPRQSYPYTVKPQVTPAPVDHPTFTEEPTRRMPPPQPQEEVELQEQQPPEKPQDVELEADLNEETGSVSSIHLYNADPSASLYAKVDKSKKGKHSEEDTPENEVKKEENEMTVYENVAATEPDDAENEEDKESAL